MLLYFIYIENKQPAIPQVTRMIFIHLLYTKDLLVLCLLFYSSQRVNRNCTNSLAMNHLYFLHVLTIFNHFWNSIIPRYDIKLGDALALKLLSF